MSMFKGGGKGFLHNATLTIIGITFDTKDWPGDKKKDPYTTISAKLTYRLDGATADAFTFLKAGFFYPENQSISDDGTTLTSDRDGSVLQGGTEFSKFIESIDKIDPSIFEGADGRSFGQASGLRVTTVRVQDEEDKRVQAEYGKRKGKKVKEGQKGPGEFNRDHLEVSAVLGRVEVKASAGGAKKTTAASAKKTTAAAPKAAATVDTDAADAALLAIIEAGKGSVERKVMGSKVTRYRLNTNMEEAAGEQLRTILMSDEYINDAVKRGVIDLDGGVITKA